MQIIEMWFAICLLGKPADLKSAGLLKEEKSADLQCSMDIRINLFSSSVKSSGGISPSFISSHPSLFFSKDSPCYTSCASNSVFFIYS